MCDIARLQDPGINHLQKRGGGRCPDRVKHRRRNKMDRVVSIVVTLLVLASAFGTVASITI